MVHGCRLEPLQPGLLVGRRVRQAQPDRGPSMAIRRSTVPFDGARGPRTLHSRVISPDTRVTKISAGGDNSKKCFRLTCLGRS
jgi:hypothetical protein